MRKLFALSLLLLLFDRIEPIKWIALSHVPQPWTEPNHCPHGPTERKKFGLVGYQAKLCKRNPDIMPVIMESARETRRVCEETFADRRWNCSTLAQAPKLAADLSKGTREQAFVYGLSSAAVAHGIAKACASGRLPWCPCGALPASKPQGFRWKGCSDNVEYGGVVSREWADAPWIRKARRGRRDKKKPRLLADAARPRNRISFESFMSSGDDDDDLLHPRLKMNKHNNQVGRKILGAHRERKCKCHGVSSSCTVKTCWESLPSLTGVGAALREAYVHATEVRGPRRLAAAPDAAQAAATQEFHIVGLEGRVSPSDLVYIRKSPDYCTEDERVGSPGTKGRECNATSATHSNCDSMCCGRGFQTSVEERVENCECKYVHCCYVKCKQCTTTVNKHFCK